MRNRRREELTTPEQIDRAERAAIYWARKARGLCARCGARSEGIMDCFEPDLCRLRSAAFEAAKLYEERTYKVAANTADINEVHPGSRVPWSEVRSRWLPDGNVVEDRVRWQPLFEASMKRRALLGVLRGKVSASEWVAKEANRKRKRRRHVLS
jgi:hypothetical protein